MVTDNENILKKTYLPKNILVKIIIFHAIILLEKIVSMNVRIYEKDNQIGYNRC